MLGHKSDGVKRKREVKRGSGAGETGEKGGRAAGKEDGVSGQEEGRGQPWLQSTRTKQVPCTA